MKVSVLALLCMVAVSLAQPPPPPPAPPRISETFSSKFHVEAKSNGQREHTYYNGELACDFEAKKRIVIQTMVQPDKPKDHNWNLQRYDSDFQRSYSFSWTGEDPSPSGKCLVSSLTGDMPSVWSWTLNTTYDETINVDNQRIDIFTTKVNDTEIAIGVSQQHPNVPYLTSIQLEDFYAVYYYLDFDPTAPDPKVFDIPDTCHANFTFKPFN